MPRRPLRILLISNHRRFKIHFRAYPWARELTRLGHEVDVMCHANTERVSTRVRVEHGFRIIENPDLLVGALRQGWDPYCAARRARFLFRESKAYDLIHCLDTRLAVIWPALAYARAKSIPIVSDWIDWWGRGGLIQERRPRWYQVLFGGVETWFEEHYRNRLDGLTAISHALLERAVALGCPRDRCIVINGAADLDTFANPAAKDEARARVQLPTRAPVLCFSGLDVLIDLPLAVKAFELVRRDVPDARLLLVGPDERTVRDMVGDPSAMDAVVALGPVPYGDLPKILPAADAFLMPYPNKVVNIGRWPNKIGDYMAVARPTVSNPVGEVKMLFERHEVGVLCDETPAAMARAAADLLRDPARADALGTNARRVAENELNWAHQVTRLESWYYDILSRARSGAGG